MAAVFVGVVVGLSEATAAEIVDECSPSDLIVASSDDVFDGDGGVTSIVNPIMTYRSWDNKLS